MMSLNFSKDSWHYKVAKFGTLRTYGGETDMCHYVRSFIWGVVKGLVVGVIIGALASLVLACEGAFIGSFIAAVMTGVWAFEGFAVGGVIINSIALGLVTIFGTAYKYEQYRDANPRKRKPPKPDGFVKNAYRGWKDKYCAKVKIERTAEEKAEDAQRAAYEAEWEAQCRAQELVAQATANSEVTPELEAHLDEIIKDLDATDESQPKS